ncbi:MAG: hypothetical protein LBP35_06100 [Candidatus Ancillula trichonymphae]|jgi:DNA polymerase-3 subunit delta|nr:hypothetical protein [Candidatus Ancillula trichonymphae]
MITLIQGSEEFFIKRGLQSVVEKVRQKYKNADIITLEANVYAKGDVQTAFAPSLLSSSAIVVVENAENCTDALIEDVVEIVGSVQKGQALPGALVILHSGAVRGKKMITALKSAASSKFVELVEAKPLKHDDEKISFVGAEFRKLNKSIQNDAANALVLAVGDDSAELAGYIHQIADDMPEENTTVTKKVVDFYFGGVNQVNIFDIVNAAVEGNLTRALTLFKLGTSNGLALNALVLAMASKLRQLGKVARMNSRSLTAGEVGLTPWQVRDAQNHLKRFDSSLLATSFEALAHANVACVGQDADGGYLAVEKAIITICR